MHRLPPEFVHVPDAWIALRQSDHPGVVMDGMPTNLVRMPLSLFTS